MHGENVRECCYFPGKLRVETAEGRKCLLFLCNIYDVSSVFVAKNLFLCYTYDRS